MTASHETYMSYVEMARANPTKTTTETLAMWHEWCAEVYGDSAAMIDGRAYPPGTRQDAPFKGSILWTGSTPSEVRYLKRYGRTEFILNHAYGFEASTDGMADDEKALAENILSGSAKKPNTAIEHFYLTRERMLSQKGMTLAEWEAKVQGDKK